MNRTVLPYVLLLLFVLNTASSMAQTAGSKPRLFDNFPATVSFSETVLSQAFTAAASQPAAFSFSADFLFQGTVISNTAKYGSLQTVVIKSAAFADAVFVLSKITAKDNSATYKGRIVNTKYADGYELRKNESGNYELVKFETARQLQDCSL